jgi:hypothetical protein
MGPRISIRSVASIAYPSGSGAREVKLFEEDESEIRIKAATKTDIPSRRLQGR